MLLILAPVGIPSWTPPGTGSVLVVDLTRPAAAAIRADSASTSVADAVTARPDGAGPGKEGPREGLVAMGLEGKDSGSPVNGIGMVDAPLQMGQTLSAGALGPEVIIETVYNLVPGVRLLELTGQTADSRPLRVHILEVDLRNELLEIRPVLAAGGAGAREEVGAMAAGRGAVAAVNGGFFASGSGYYLPVGNLVVDGSPLAVSDIMRPSVGWGPGDRAMIGYAAPVVQVRLGGDSLSIPQVNAPLGGRLTLYTPEWGPATGTPSGTHEIQVAPVSGGRLQVVGVTEMGNAPISRGGFTLAWPAGSPGSADMGTLPAPGEGFGSLGETEGADRGNAGTVTAANGGSSGISGGVDAPGEGPRTAWQTVPSSLLPPLGTPVDWALEWPGLWQSVAGPPQYLLTGGPLLVEDGEPLFQAVAEGFTGGILGRRARTAWGFTTDGRTLLVVVDGGQADWSSGLTLEETALLMASLGSRQALGLDGGGSSTLWIRDPGPGVETTGLVKSTTSDASEPTAAAEAEGETVDPTAAAGPGATGVTADSLSGFWPDYGGLLVNRPSDGRPRAVHNTLLILYGVRVVLDGERLYFDVPPRVEGNRVLVPLRGVLEKLGAVVEWDEASQTVRAVRGNRVVEVTVGLASARVDGRIVLLDVAALQVDYRVMVPLRFLAEALGASVAWDESAKTAAINTASP